MTKKLTLAILLFCISLSTYATHLRAGEISYKLIDEALLKYRITIEVYTDINSEVLFGEGLLYFGDGEYIELPMVESTGLSEELGYATYSIEHTYKKPDDYLIYYVEANRNPNVLNLDNSVNVPFYTETFLHIDKDPTLNAESPKSLAPFVFTAQFGDKLRLSLASKIKNGLKLRYQLVPCNRDYGVTAAEYRMPKGIAINPITGLLTWNPYKDDIYAVGQFNFAVKTVAFAKVNGKYKVMSYVMRDFQIILKDSEDSIEIDTLSNDQLGKDNSIVLEPGKTTDLIMRNVSDSKVAFNVYSELEGQIKSKLIGYSIVVNITMVDSLKRENPYTVIIRANNGTSGLVKDFIYNIYSQHTEEPNLEIPSIQQLVSSVEPLNNTTLHPNPASDRIYIENHFNDYPILILDSWGRKKEVAISENGYIDISNFTPGQYIIYNGQKYQRFIKI